MVLPCGDALKSEVECRQSVTSSIGCNDSGVESPTSPPRLLPSKERNARFHSIGAIARYPVTEWSEMPGMAGARCATGLSSVQQSASAQFDRLEKGHHVKKNRIARLKYEEYVVFRSEAVRIRGVVCFQFHDSTTVGDEVTAASGSKAWLGRTIGGAVTGTKYGGNAWRWQ